MVAVYYARSPLNRVAAPVWFMFSLFGPGQLMEISTRPPPPRFGYAVPLGPSKCTRVPSFLFQNCKNTKLLDFRHCASESRGEVHLHIVTLEDDGCRVVGQASFSNPNPLFSHFSSPTEVIRLPPPPPFPFAYVPVHLRQTNNTAELFATVRALQFLPPGRYAFCLDSSYVILGAAGTAKQWKLRSWKGSCGPVANVSIWEQLLHELDQPRKTIQWVKVPSHVTVEENNEADRLLILVACPAH